MGGRNTTRPALCNKIKHLDFRETHASALKQQVGAKRSCAPYDIRLNFARQREFFSKQ